MLWNHIESQNQDGVFSCIFLLWLRPIYSLSNKCYWFKYNLIIKYNSHSRKVIFFLLTWLLLSQVFLVGCRLCSIPPYNPAYVLRHLLVSWHWWVLYYISAHRIIYVDLFMRNRHIRDKWQHTCLRPEAPRLHLALQHFQKAIFVVDTCTIFIKTHFIVCVVIMASMFLCPLLQGHHFDRR